MVKILKRLWDWKIGADDYIVKPFSPGEIMARIKAILRRIQPKTENLQVFSYDNLQINLADYTVSIDNKVLYTYKKRN